MVRPGAEKTQNTASQETWVLCLAPSFTSPVIVNKSPDIPVFVHLQMPVLPNLQGVIKSNRDASVTSLSERQRSL